MRFSATTRALAGPGLLALFLGLFLASPAQAFFLQLGHASFGRGVSGLLYWAPVGYSYGVNLWGGGRETHAGIELSSSFDASGSARYPAPVAPPHAAPVSGLSIGGHAGDAASAPLPVYSRTSSSYAPGARPSALPDMTVRLGSSFPDLTPAFP